jgi:predicted dehydrogenase
MIAAEARETTPIPPPPEGPAVSRILLALPLVLLAALLPAARPASGAKEDKKAIRVGIIGADTSHAIVFTSMLNSPKATGELAGVRVVAAYPGGSPDVPDSRDRVAGFTKQLRDKYGVEIVDSIDALLAKVDVVLLESVDGRPHLRQVIPVFKAGKLVFIDKPIAGSLADALRIFALSSRYKVPCFSSSSLRFSPGIAGMRHNKKVGKVVGCDAWGPCSLEPHHPDLFWYGVHGVEALYTIMGPGCEKVTRAHTADADLVTGVWKDGRIGTYRGLRTGKYDFGAMVFGTKNNLPAGSYEGYRPLVEEICKFFRTGRPPVRAEETIEMFTFMEAADESKRQGGAPVTLASVLARARAEAARGRGKE